MISRAFPDHPHLSSDGDGDEHQGVAGDRALLDLLTHRDSLERIVRGERLDILRELLEGLPIREGMAACGTAAATAQPVVIHDVMVDPMAADFRWVPARFGLRSVWSHPVTTAAGEGMRRSIPSHVCRTEPRSCGDADQRDPPGPA